MQVLFSYRCGDGLIGLRNQSTINNIVSSFITHYDKIFKEVYEEYPVDAWV